MNDETRSYSQDPENHPARNLDSIEATGMLLDSLSPHAKQVYADMFMKRLERLEAEMAKKRKAQDKPADLPKKPATEQIALRIPTDVLERWRASGPGWQTRLVQRLSAP